MGITYLRGDATRPMGDGNKIIAHICNNIGGWGRGFVLAVTSRWPEPERDYRRWSYDLNGSKLPLGEVQLVEVEAGLWVANMIGQYGISISRSHPPAIRYEAVDGCLQRLGKHARDLKASVHMPRIGCGLAGGSWDRIEPIINLHLSDIDVFVYDPGA